MMIDGYYGQLRSNGYLGVYQKSFDTIVSVLFLFDALSKHISKHINKEHDRFPQAKTKPMTGIQSPLTKST